MHFLELIIRKESTRFKLILINGKLFAGTLYVIVYLFKRLYYDSK
jgi:hypothetical protein